MIGRFIPHPIHGQLHVGGRKMPTAPRCGRALRLEEYSGPPIPTPPAIIDYTDSALVMACLRTMLGNDLVGDCTVADVLHALSLIAAAAGLPIIPFVTAQAMTIYSAATGYDPTQTDASGNNPTDNGAELQDILEWLLANGFPPNPNASKLLAFYPLDTTAPLPIQQGMLIGGGAVVCGVALSDNAVSQIPTLIDGGDWDLSGTPNPANGHAFPKVADGKVATWSMVLNVNDDVLQEQLQTQNGGEAWAIYAQEMAQGIQRSGIAAADSLAMFKGLGAALGGVLPAGA